ncbi:MAG: SDR family oxidoreductase [Flavobacteriales bacterium]|nr:SDR family oxidoreductase [Flavobacteriales bacterium]
MDSAPFLIIGGTSGIGRATAERLIQQGHQVITVGRGADAPSGVMDHIVADVVQHGIPTDRIPTHLAGMAYCPGSIVLKPLRSTTLDDLRSALEVNLVGAFRCAQATSESLKRTPGSAMLFFSTVAVGQGMPFHTAIAAAKGGVEGLARSLAAELAPHVRVNCIAPSLTRTALSDKLLNSPEKEKSAADRHPMKRIGTVHDIAAVAQLLLTPEGSWISGQVIGVDGGLSVLR